MQAKDQKGYKMLESLMFHMAKDIKENGATLEGTNRIIEAFDKAKLPLFKR